MAFLCPVRMRRSKKKATNADIERDLPHPGVGLGLNHGMGRITGSSSIETLVRVGIEKEHGLSPDSKMVVLHDFTPCVDDELEVKRGQVVNILYRENDWVYVIGQDTRQEGFIPYSYCAPYNTQLADLAIKKKLPRDQGVSNLAGGGGAEHGDMLPLLGAESSKLELIEEVIGTTNGVCGGGGSTSLKGSEVSPSLEPEYLPFPKTESGRYIVLYTFIARDENDVSVERGEFVTMLNRDDPDWFWIVRSDGQEGFIPSAFVYPADSVLQTQHKMLTAAAGTRGGDGAADGNINKTGLGMELNGTSLGGNLNSLGQPPLTTNQLETNCVNGLQQQQQQQQQHQQQQQVQTVQQQQVQPNAQQQQQIAIGADDLRYHGTELVMLYDYKAQAPDDLSVRRGDWIYADLNNQTVDGWLWAYAPKTRKYGFIPKAYARPPAMTSL